MHVVMVGIDSDDPELISAPYSQQQRNLSPSRSSSNNSNNYYYYYRPTQPLPSMGQEMSTSQSAVMRCG